MTRDEIISMAREAGCGWTRNGTEPLLTGEEQIQRFADLVAIKVAASEREWMQETNIKLIAEAVSAEREALRDAQVWLELLRDEKGILGKLARFADSCAEASFDGCDIDGWTIQEWMEGEGLLVRRPDLVVPCGEFCSCSESMGEGQKCDRLFLSDEFKQALSATAREPKS